MNLKGTWASQSSSNFRYFLCRSHPPDQVRQKVQAQKGSFSNLAECVILPKLEAMQSFKYFHLQLVLSTHCGIFQKRCVVNLADKSGPGILQRRDSTWKDGLFLLVLSRLQSSQLHKELSWLQLRANLRWKQRLRLFTYFPFKPLEATGICYLQGHSRKKSSKTFSEYQSPQTPLQSLTEEVPTPFS